MQRILRSTTLYSTLSSDACEQNEVLLKVCPPHLSNVFAVSRCGADGQLEWWSPLGGHAQPYATLTSDQQAQLLKILEQRKKSLSELADHLEKNTQTDAALSIRKLLQETDFNQLYSIDNQPVVFDWHIPVPFKEEISAPALVNNAALHAQGLGLTATGVPIAVKKRKLWPWLLLLLLLLALGLLAWWLWMYNSAAELSTEQQTEQNNPHIEQPADNLLVDSGEPVEITPTAETSAEIVKAVVEDAQANNSKPAEKITQKQPSPKKGRIENYACSDNAATKKPDFVTVFDTSGSMRINIHASLADEKWLISRGSLYDDQDFHPRRLIALSPPSREQVAKDAYAQMLTNLHPNIDTRLITFDGTCGPAIDHGLFSRKQRPQLIERLAEVPAYGATPLAASLRQAASQVDGVDKDAMIILFIDGEDGCGEDVCAVSEQLAVLKPRLQINVVDISGNGLSSCAAQATNGRIYSSKDIEQINNLFKQAAEEFSEHQCK